MSVNSTVQITVILEGKLAGFRVNSQKLGIYDGIIGGSKLTLLKSNKVCRGRGSGWMNGSMKHRISVGEKGLFPVSYPCVVPVSVPNFNQTLTIVLSHHKMV